jgi:hypothetical protein
VYLFLENLFTVCRNGDLNLTLLVTVRLVNCCTLLLVHLLAGSWQYESLYLLLTAVQFHDARPLQAASKQWLNCTTCPCSLLLFYASYIWEWSARARRAEFMEVTRKGGKSREFGCDAWYVNPSAAFIPRDASSCAQYELLFLSE